MEYIRFVLEYEIYKISERSYPSYRLLENPCLLCHGLDPWFPKLGDLLGRSWKRHVTIILIRRCISWWQKREEPKGVLGSCGLITSRYRHPMRLGSTRTLSHRPFAKIWKRWRSLYGLRLTRRSLSKNLMPWHRGFWIEAPQGEG